MTNELVRAQIFNSMELKETDELLAIWTKNDHDEWGSDTFDIIHEILEKRIGQVPPQDNPIHTQEEDMDDEEEEEEDDDSQTIFYNPDSLMWIADLTSIFAWVFGLVNLAQAVYYITLAISQNQFTNLNAVFAIVLAIGRGIFYFLVLKGVSAGLYILMEFEFNSRNAK